MRTVGMGAKKAQNGKDELLARIEALEKENAELRAALEESSEPREAKSRRAKKSDEE